MIFDVKMEDLRRKDGLVAGEHVTELPATIKYAILVSRDTARVAFTLAVLNNLSVESSGHSE